MNKNGKIYVVGIGPGKKADMTFKAYEAMEKSDIIVGYKTYTDLIKEYFPNTEIKSSSMMKEVDRCIEVLELAKSGKNVDICQLIVSKNKKIKDFNMMMAENPIYVITAKK